MQRQQHSIWHAAERERAPHLGAAAKRDARRGQADRAAGGVDQDAVPRAQPAAHHQGDVPTHAAAEFLNHIGPHFPHKNLQGFPQRSDPVGFSICMLASGLPSWQLSSRAFHVSLMAEGNGSMRATRGG